MGCATYRSPDDVIAIDSSPQGADIFLHGKKVGTTPELIKLDRKFREKIELRHGGDSETLQLRGSYRFKGSFWPNFAFLSLAPIGWVVDIVNGSAWDYDSYYEVSFDGKKPVHTKPPRMKIAIAPPKSDYSMFSDELGSKLELQLKKEFPQYEVIPYKNTVGKFVYNNFDYSRSKSEVPWPDVFYDANSDMIYAAEVKDNGNKTRVKGAIYNAYSKTPTDFKRYEFADDRIKTLEEVQKYDDRPVYFHILPNTIALDLETNSSSIDIGPNTYNSSVQHSDDFWGKAGQFVSVVALRRYQPPTVDKLSGWRFAFNPSVLISHSRQKFEDSPEVKDYTFTVSHIDASYGPQYTFSVKKWQFYASLMLALAYDQIKVDGETYGSDNIGATIEFGTTYFFTPKWSVRLSSRSVSTNEEIWEEAILGATGTQYDIGSSQVATTGFSIGYTFSDYIHPGRR